MGATSSAAAEHPLSDAKKGRWEEYFVKVGRGKGALNGAAKDGWTALHFAARQNSAEVIAKLIEMGADFDQKTVMGRTPLAVAVRYNKTTEAASCLLRHGASPEATDNEGDTPLHTAAQQGFIDAIVTLIEVGADTDATNRFGWTPLHKAALLRGRMPQAAIRLVELGADIGIRTKNGTLASDIARTSGCADLAAWLEQELARGRPKRCPRRPQPALAPVSEMPARTVPETPGVIWSSPSPSEQKLDGGYVRPRLDSPGSGSKAGKKRWNKARSLGDISDGMPREALTEQLGLILHELGLRDKVPAAVDWCLQQGAESLDDIIQDTGCSKDLADALGLPRIKRNKFIARLDPVENDVMRVKSL